MSNSTLILSAFLLAWTLLWYTLSRLLQRMDIADIAWGMGVAVMAMLSLALSSDLSTPRIVVSTAGLVWGLRLAWHIYRRSHGRPEDARYRAWRAEWGSRVHVRSFFQVFVLQTLLMAVVSLPIIVPNLRSPPTDGEVNMVLLTVGGLLYVTGLLFESIADWQLARFLSDASNTGKVMRVGLWRRSRHPNYFGEVVLWWGIAAMALAQGAPAVVLVSPVLVTLLIFKVSGIPMLEEKMARDPKYADYIANTNVFWPF